MQRLLVLNLFIALLWPILNSDFTLRALLIGFFTGFILLSLVQRIYGLYTWKAASFTFYLLYAILRSNLRVAWAVLGRTAGVAPELRPGIVAVPLSLTNPFDITLLATAITLTPGTLSVDIGIDEDGALVPYRELDGEAAAIGVSAESEGREGERSAGDPLPGGSGAASLLVHSIDVADPHRFRAEIKRSFERPLLDLRRTLVELDETAA